MFFSMRKATKRANLVLLVRAVYITREAAWDSCQLLFEFSEDLEGLLRKQYVAEMEYVKQVGILEGIKMVACIEYGVSEWLRIFEEAVGDLEKEKEQ